MEIFPRNAVHTNTGILNRLLERFDDVIGNEECFQGCVFFFCFSFFSFFARLSSGFFERLSCDLKTRGEIVIRIACNCKERRKDNVCCAHWKIFWNGFV